jgi:hypothetical protein
MDEVTKALVANASRAHRRSMALLVLAEEYLAQAKTARRGGAR